MSRFTVAPLVALLALLGFAGPAAATGAGGPSTVPVVVGFQNGTFAVDRVPAARAASVIANLERDRDIAYAEVDVAVHATASLTPNDAMFDRQWGPTRVRAPEAWAQSTGATSVTVAVVDTGVDASQPDLAGAVLPGADFVGDGKTGDPNGHGTGVAGVIAARGNNGIGIAGYCWACQILPVRVLNADGGGAASTVANGIRYAVDHGANIINLSLSGDSSSSALDAAVAYARERNVIVIAAAGNQTASGQDLTRPQYPAASPGAIAVVATTQSDGVYDWSYRGPWAEVGAPGCVVTTAPGGYQGECGTSFASPAVAGILGLALAAYPQATPDQVEAALYASSADVLGSSASHGRVDAAAVLNELAGTFGVGRTAERIAGSTRVSTAVALSQHARSAAPSVVVARADDYADALAAAPLAGRLGAPVLLTPSSMLAPEVADEVRRLGARSAVLVGGTGVLGPQVEEGLRGAGVTDVQRLAGSSRYETAALIAGAVGGTSVFAVDASSWPDAVAVSGLAAQTRSPILLVDHGSVPTATLDALHTLGVTSVTIVGGVGVVSDAVLGRLVASGATVTRIAGATRYATSKAVADAAVAAGADPTHIWAATGTDWPDALASGPASAADGGVLLLVDGHDEASPSPLLSWLTATRAAAADTPQELFVVGGDASISSAVFYRLSRLL